MANVRKNMVKAEITKLGRAITPKGFAAWAYLTEPAAGLDRDRQKITVFMKKDDPEFQTFLKTVLAARDKFAQEAGVKAENIGLPIKTATEKELEKTSKRISDLALGDPFMEFNTSPREKDGQVIPIPVVGTDAKPTNKDVWMGDTVRVQTSLVGWKNAGKFGVKGYLQGVQLLVSTSTGGSGTDMFAAAERLETAEFTPATESNLDLESLLDAE